MTMVSLLAGYLLAGCIVTTIAVIYSLASDGDINLPGIGVSVLIWPLVAFGLFLIAVTAVIRRFTR